MPMQPSVNYRKKDLKRAERDSNPRPLSDFLKTAVLLDTKTVDSVEGARWLARQTPNILCYYSTNCNTIQIWSWCSRYLSSVGNVYQAIYVASYVGRKSEAKKCRQKDLKNVTSFVINLLNNKTIILLNLAEYRLILANSAYGLVG